MNRRDLFKLTLVAFVVRWMPKPALPMEHFDRMDAATEAKWVGLQDRIEFPDKITSLHAFGDRLYVGTMSGFYDVVTPHGVVRYVGPRR